MFQGLTSDGKRAKFEFDIEDLNFLCGQFSVHPHDHDNAQDDLRLAIAELLQRKSAYVSVKPYRV